MSTSLYMNARVQHHLGRGALYLLTAITSLVFIFPFFWTVASSLKTVPELYAYPPKIIPAVPQWNNYVRIFEVVPFWAWLVNTTVIVVLHTTGAVLSSALVAYSFARFEFRGRNLIFLLTLGTMMLPSEVTLIPQYILFHKLHWINTIKPLWVPYWLGGGAFAIFLMRQFFASLPPELDEAAFIDGAGYFRIFTRVLLPLCGPVIATIAVITFIATWNDFMGPLIYLNSPDKFTISLGLQFFKDGGGVGEGGEPLQHVMMAATVLSVVPCVVLFFAAQRYFVRGVVLSGIKG